MDSYLTLGDWLAHPLILLVVSALASSYIIPLLTRRWQDHQKELELKTTLVREINDSLTSMVTRIEVVEVLARVGSTDRFDKAYDEMQSYYIEWGIKSAVIGANIQAFFIKRDDIVSEWEDLSETIRKLEGLSELDDENDRKNYIQIIKKELPESLRSEVWDKLINRKSQKYLDNWGEVKKLIVDRKVKLVREIIKMRI